MVRRSLFATIRLKGDEEYRVRRVRTVTVIAFFEERSAVSVESRPENEQRTSR